MVFSSLLFLFRFLPITMLAYYLLPKKMHNLVLFIASLIFYAWGEPVYVVLILFSTVLDYCCGWFVHAMQEKGQSNKAKLGVLVSAVVNLGLLGFFKYANFLLRTIHTITGLSVPVLHLALPIGISFYTFQTMSYTIDVYRKDAPVQKNFIAFGAYVSLFPQLIAGPIIRYKDLADQMIDRTFSLDLFTMGVMRFIVGLGKKVLIANQVGALWHQIAKMGGGLTTATSWIGILAYTLQIYFDFSGYSDMAIGLGGMFGFRFPENFNYPYESRSITEFWRRWHMTLGTWFKEYVYIPLGGNRKGFKRQMFNIAVVWILTGLWHGAYMNFVLWGVYYGVLLIIEKFLWKKYLSKVPAVFQHIFTMFFVMIGWSLFCYQDMAHANAYFNALFFHAHAGLFNRETLYLLSSYGALLIIGCIGSLSIVKKVVNRLFFTKETTFGYLLKSAFVVLIFGACLAMLVNSSYNPFLYFRF